MSEQDDKSLVVAALAGSQKAFSKLVARHQNRVYATAVAVLADFELAQDVAQEAFLCAFRDLYKLQDPERFGAWVSGIARYTAHAAGREMGRVRRLVECYRGEVPLLHKHTPERQVEREEGRQIVQRALERLNRKDREVLSLYYLENWPPAQVARALSTSEVAVKGRLQRARQRLKKELKMVEEHFAEARLSEDFVRRIEEALQRAVEDREQRSAAIDELGALGAGAVEPLIKALTDERKWARHAAALALSAIGDTRAMEPLMSLLSHQGDRGWGPQKEDGWPDMETLGQVLAVPGMREVLLEKWQQVRGLSPEQQERENMHVYARVLSQAKGDEEVYTCLYDTFTSAESHPWLRQEALEALCTAFPEKAEQLIVEGIESGDPTLAYTAFDLATRSFAVPPLEICARAIGSAPHWLTREQAVHLLLKHGAPGRQRLEQIARAGTVEERAAVMLAQARRGDEEAGDILDRELLGGRREGFVPWTHRDKRRFGGASLWENMWHLARAYPEQGGPLVEGLFRAGDPRMRKAALRILARQRGANFLPELRRCLGGGRPRFGEVARSAFWQMYKLGEDAEPTAREMLASDDWLERKAAVCLLKRWGKLSDEERQRAETDEHVAVRRAVGKK